MKYTELPTREQPRRRLQEVGATALTTAELLSVALWISDSEAAQALAQAYHEAGSLGRITRDRIKQIKGLGDRYADALAAVFELGRREALAQMPERPAIHSPSDVADLVMYEMSVLEQEQMRVVLLDTRNRVVRIVTLYQGCLNTSPVRIAEIFREAIRENAAAIIVCHNHPSGDPSPSPEDVAVTRAIVQAGKLMDIEVLDHMVIGKGRYVSLKERGLGFAS